jgi:hypothetical protein
MERSSMPGREISRRVVLERFRVMLGVVCTGAIITRPSQVLAKISGQQAQYQSRPNGDRRCSECSFFVAPASCQLVDGEISPDGWCRFFAAKQKS